MKIVFEEMENLIIAQAIAEQSHNFGKIYVDIDGIEFEVDFEKSWDGYQEEDTGAYITTDSWVRVCNIQCGDIKLDFDSKKIESAAQSFMYYV